MRLHTSAKLVFYTIAHGIALVVASDYIRCEINYVREIPITQSVC